MKSGEVIDGYKILHTVKIDGVEEIVAQSIALADERYKLIKGDANNDLKLMQYSVIFESGDYLKVMRKFIARLDVHLDSLDLDRLYRGTPVVNDFPLTGGDCVPNGMDSDLKGKVVAIKTSVLSPEYRSMSHQLQLVTGGFGSSPDASGRAVYCTNIYSGEKSRFERADILGVIADNAQFLPKWFEPKLVKLLEEPEQLKQSGNDARLPAKYESVLAKIEEGKKNQNAERPKTSDAVETEKTRQPQNRRKNKSESEM